MGFYISYSKEAKSLTFRRGSEVSQVTTATTTTTTATTPTTLNPTNPWKIMPEPINSTLKLFFDGTGSPSFAASFESRGGGHDGSEVQEVRRVGALENPEFWCVCVCACVYLRGGSCGLGLGLRALEVTLQGPLYIVTSEISARCLGSRV